MEGDLEVEREYRDRKAKGECTKEFLEEKKDLS